MASRNDSFFKAFEWLNYLIASEFHRHREQLNKQSKERTNEFIWPVFSLMGVFCINQVMKNPREMSPIDAGAIILGYLVTYFVIVKKVLLPLCQWMVKMGGRLRGKAIDTSEEIQIEFVSLFNSTLCNQVISAYSFMQQALDDQVLNEDLRKYYIAESVYCLQNTIIEIDTIESRKEIKSNIVFAGKGKVIKSKHIRIYRYNAIISIIKDILNHLDDESQNKLQCCLQKDPLLREDIKNLKYTVSRW